MATLESIQRKMRSAGQLQGVVRTMKTIAAVAIRQFEQAVEALEDYDRAVELGFQVLLSAPGSDVTARPAGPPRRVGAIVFGSDQGMVGRFNEEIVEEAAAWAAGWEKRGAGATFVAVGERVLPPLEEAGREASTVFSLPTTPEAIAALVGDVLFEIESIREREELDAVTLFHNRPTRGAGREPVRLQVLPPSPEWLASLRERPWDSRSLPLFTMEAEALFSALLREHLFVSLFRACALSIAAENAARVSAMQAAEQNIEERLDELNAAYRHERQRGITEELLDIVSGFEALSSS